MHSLSVLYVLISSDIRKEYDIIAVRSKEDIKRWYESKVVEVQGKHQITHNSYSTNTKIVGQKYI